MGIKTPEFDIDNTEGIPAPVSISQELPAGGKLQLRKDESTPGRIIYGWASPTASQTDSTWLIYADDQVGVFFSRSFAELASVPTADFVHQWSNRNAILPAVGFLNEFSVFFPGTGNSYGEVPSSAGLNFANTAAFSISIYFKTNTTSQQLFQKASAPNGNNGYQLSMDGAGRLEFAFRGSGAGDRIRVRTDSFDGSDNQWHHFLVTKASGSTAASSVTVYIDGAEETVNVLNDTLSGTTTSSGTFNVASNVSQGNNFEGYIDEVAIWDAELSLSEVEEIYNANNGAIDLSTGTGQISTNLVSWWRFGDGSFTSVPDVPDENGSNDMTLGTDVNSGFVLTVVPP